MTVRYQRIVFDSKNRQDKRTAMLTSSFEKFGKHGDSLTFLQLNNLLI